MDGGKNVREDGESSSWRDNIPLLRWEKAKRTDSPRYYWVVDVTVHLLGVSRWLRFYESIGKF